MRIWPYRDAKVLPECLVPNTLKDAWDLHVGLEELVDAGGASESFEQGQSGNHVKTPMQELMVL